MVSRLQDPVRAPRPHPSHPLNPPNDRILDTMQMSVRTRILDMLPVLVVFAIVAACSTYLLVVYVVEQPVVVPPPQVTPLSELPGHAPMAPYAPGDLR